MKWKRCWPRPPKPARARAGYVLLRLPLEIKDLFREWLEANVPGRAKHVMALVRSMRGGKDYDSQWNTRMTRNRALCRDDGAALPHGGEEAGAEPAVKAAVRQQLQAPAPDWRSARRCSNVPGRCRITSTSRAC